MRALVFANGEMPEPERMRRRLQLQPGDLIVAADGGVRHCLALGCLPDRVIGDLDSMAPDTTATLQRAEVPLERYPAFKDETDLELALLYAARQQADLIVVIGGSGGRLDMTIANLLLLTHPELAGRRVEFWEGSQTAWLIQPPGATIGGAPGDTLSLIPLGGAALGVTTQGLHYGLHDEALAFGPARGVSNVLSEAGAAIQVRHGLLLAVHTPGRA